MTRLSAKPLLSAARPASQKGVTLLEVMIGFVIFSASLVAVLDYVGNQVYLQHQAQKNQQKTFLLYELATQAGLGLQHQIQLIADQPDLQVTFSDSVVDESAVKNTETRLFESKISVSDGDSTLEWMVLEVR